jgi:prolipoprotein diacylglyceryltransferase
METNLMAFWHGFLAAVGGTIGVVVTAFAFVAFAYLRETLQDLQRATTDLKYESYRTERRLKELEGSNDEDTEAERTTAT